MADKRDERAQSDEAPLIQVYDDKKGADTAAPSRRARTAAALASVACVVLIIVSLGFVHPAAGGAWSLAWIAESLQSGGVAQSETSDSGSNSSGGASSSSKGASAKSGASSNAKDEAKDESKSSSKDSKQDSSSASKGEDSSSNGGSDTAASGGGAPSSSSNQGAGSHASGGSSSGGSAGAAGSGTSNSGGSSGGGSQDDGLITVTVSVTSSAVGNPVSAGGTYTFRQGATVYDALCALGLSVNAHGSAYGTYVAAIGGLAEKEHGSSSGWMYSVNGSTPMVACSGYTLSNGDNVVWYYVTG